MKKILLTTAKRTCCIFTALYFAIMAIGASFDLSMGVSFGNGLLLFLCALAIAASLEIFEIKTIPIYAKIALNYVILLASFFIIFFSIAKRYEYKGSQILTAVILFSFFYAVAFGITVLIKKIVGKSSKNEKTKKGSSNEKAPKPKKEDYTSLFK